MSGCANLRPSRGVPHTPGQFPDGIQSRCRNHIEGRLLRNQGLGCNSRCPTPMSTIPQTHRYPRDRVLTGSANASVRCTDRAQSPCPDATASDADLGTKWEQDRQSQPNAAAIYVRQGSIVTALKPNPLSITATCFQYHLYGRSPGLKIRCVCHPPTCPRSFRSRGRFPLRNATDRRRDDRAGSEPQGHALRPRVRHASQVDLARRFACRAHLLLGPTPGSRGTETVRLRQRAAGGEGTASRLVNRCAVEITRDRQQAQACDGPGPQCMSLLSLSGSPARRGDSPA